MPTAGRRPGTRRLSGCGDEDRAQLVALCSRPEYAALTPYEICADQLDRHGRCLCSVSTLCRVLAEHGQSVRRDRTRRPSRHRPPAVYADGPNQVWMWDIPMREAGSGVCSAAVSLH